MAFIPTPNCVQARVIFQETDGTEAQNVLYCATASVPTEDDLNEIGAALVTGFNAGYIAAMTSNWTLTNIVLRAVNEAEGIEINYTTDLPLNGGNGGTQTPNQVSWTTTLETGLVGRSARGRIYGVGLAFAQTINNKRLTDASRAVLQANMEAIRADLESAGHALQVVSFQTGGVPRTEGRALPVLSVEVRFPLATQRRRLS